MEEMIIWEMGDIVKMKPYEQLGAFLAVFSTLNTVIGRQIVKFKDSGDILKTEFNKLSRKKHAKCKRRFSTCCRVNIGSGNSLTDVIVNQFAFSETCVILKKQFLKSSLTSGEKALVKDIFRRIGEIATVRNDLCHWNLYYQRDKLGCIKSFFSSSWLLKLKDNDWETLSIGQIIKECEIFSTIIPVITFWIENSRNLTDIIKFSDPFYLTKLGTDTKYVDLSTRDAELD